MKPQRIILADDHILIRAGIRALLANIEAVSVVGEAGDGQDALRLVRRDKPEILLTDISMPLLNGIELTRRLSHEMPDVRVIILSMHASEDFITQALIAGARGYVLKDALPSELETSIRTVAENRIYLSSTISGIVTDKFIARMREHSD